MTDTKSVGAGLDPVDVCNLSRAELDERIAWVRGELMPHVVGRVRIPGGVALEIRNESGLEATVDHWLELERSCCGPLSWERRATSEPSRVRVEIGGVNPDGPMFARLPLLEGLEDEAASRWRRIAGASGIGSAIAVFVCCGLPMLLVPLLGAGAVGGFLRALDQPLPIALVAAGVTFLAWRAMQRRARPAEASG